MSPLAPAAPGVQAVETREPIGSDITGAGRSEVATTAYTRSPRDLLRVVVLGIATLAALAITRWGEDTILGFEQDLLDVASVLSSSAERVLAGLLSLAVLLALLGTWIVPIATRRYRLFGYVLLANAATGALFSAATWWLDRANPESLANAISERAGLDSDSVIGVVVLVQLVGAFSVLSPFVNRGWRRAGAIALPMMLTARVIVSIELPSELFVGVLIGGTVGAAVLLALGRPSRQPTEAAITAALADSALPVVSLERAKVDARGSTPYFAELADGRRVFVKVLGEDERAADLLFRLYRFLRLKNVGDERPFSNLRRTVEHEALLALYARDLDVRTPRMRGVVDVGTDSMLLAYDLIDGRSLDALADDEITDDLMRATWEQIAVLRSHRVAHRDLRRANVFVAADGSPWMIDFGFSELAASDALLRADVAQMLSSFAVVAGAERSVRCAVDVLGTDAVGAALPRLQPMALSGATQTALKAHKGLLGEIQAQVVEQCGVAEITYEQLNRVSGKTLFTLAMLAAVTYFLLPQFADLPQIIDQVKDANWWWLPAMLLASLFSYLAAAIALTGSVTEPLPVGPTMLTQVASSFASKLAPAGIGGMAVNVRFLQKQGVDEPVAVSSIGLNTAAGAVGHLTMLLVFGIWAGGDAFQTFRFPDPTIFIVVALALLAIGGLALAIPATRRILAIRLAPVLGRAVGGVTGVLQRPRKMLLLVGGSIAVTTSYLLCVYFGVQAFGGGLSFAVVGACYLLGSAVATAAPTPGGLGAMEAALIAALVAAGLDNAVAVPAVFLYRFATFWLPILPGWLSFTYLRRADYI